MRNHLFQILKEMFLMRLRASFVLLLSTLLFAASLAIAQSGNQGSIEGTVTDTSGALIAGAHVKATNVATDAVNEATAGSEGVFKFPVLPVGTYDLVIDHSGFSNTTMKGISVT